MRLVQPIPAGANIVDCVTRITSVEQAKRVKADGVDGVFQYVGKMSSNDPGLLKSHVDAILAGGLAFIAVCFADQFDGRHRADMLYSAAPDAVGLTLATDLESYRKPADAAVLALNACARDIEAALLLPMLYVGSGQPLNGEQLGRLAFERYWRSASNVPEPTLGGNPIGWCMIQHLGDPRDHRVDWRQVYRGGVNVDIDSAQLDHHGRAATWLVDVQDAPTLPDLANAG